MAIVIMTQSKRGLLFMCVANSARSQMAECLARHIAPADIQVYSAGSAPSEVNPFAVQALSEIGLTTEGQHSKGVDEIPLDELSWVVTLCAEEVCPILPVQVETLHWPHPDPAGAGETPEETLQGFRTVRDAIKSRLVEFFGSMTSP